MSIKRFLSIALATSVVTVIMAAVNVCATTTSAVGAVGFVKNSIPNLKAEKCFVVDFDQSGYTEIITSDWNTFTFDADTNIHDGNEVYVMFDTKGTPDRSDDEIKSSVKPVLGINWIESAESMKIYEHAVVTDYTDEGVSILELDDGNTFEYESPDYGIGEDVYLEFDYGVMPYFMYDDKVLKMFTFWEILEMHAVDDLEEFEGGLYARI